MSFYAIPSVNTASIAGTAKATSAASPATLAAEKAALPNRSETVDSIEKGNRSEDSGADGRQTLDTFERRQDEPDLEPEAETPAPADELLRPLDPTARTGGHLDFTA